MKQFEEQYMIAAQKALKWAIMNWARTHCRRFRASSGRGVAASVIFAQLISDIFQLQWWSAIVHDSNDDNMTTYLFIELFLLLLHAGQNTINVFQV
jgi:hypothetical protein